MAGRGMGSARCCGGRAMKIGNLLKISRELKRLLGKQSRFASPDMVERKELIFYVSHILEGMVVFDVGANMGVLTLLFSKLVGSTGTVHTFEACSETFQRLKAMCETAECHNIVLNRVAASDNIGKAKLHVYDRAHSGWNSLANRPLREYGIDLDPVAIEEVQAVTIDGYCEGNGILQIDLLKVDVEGAEYQVLQGARRMLKCQKVRCCVFEFGQTTFDMGNKPDEIEYYLKQLGYRVQNVVKGDPAFPGRGSAREACFSVHIARPKR
jgi:FkbM family methyltransferase